MSRCRACPGRRQGIRGTSGKAKGSVVFSWVWFP
ncbi:MAG: phage DNA packaging protein J [Xanthomonadaceae bacterium]|nr:phage DNA packaging protein J [Xanthomonadaceae bacterium]